MPLRDNIYLADHIPTPFVMGLFRPRIYLPSALSGRAQAYIIRPEQHHIRRGDHIVKVLSFRCVSETAHEVAAGSVVLRFLNSGPQIPDDAPHQGFGNKMCIRDSTLRAYRRSLLHGISVFAAGSQ